MFICADCQYEGPLARNGHCARCGSNAVAPLTPELLSHDILSFESWAALTVKERIILARSILSELERYRKEGLI